MILLVKLRVLTTSRLQDMLFTSASVIIYFLQLYDGIIRDAVFLHESWPWCKGQPAILSVAENGIAKVQYIHVYNS